MEEKGRKIKTDTKKPASNLKYQYANGIHLLNSKSVSICFYYVIFKSFLYSYFILTSFACIIYSDNISLHIYSYFT